MSEDRFASLPHEYPRNFVPQDLEPSDWDAIAPLFDALEGRELDTLEQVEAWLRDSSELGSVLAEVAAQRYIRMTCDTENKDHEAAYLHPHSPSDRFVRLTMVRRRPSRVCTIISASYPAMKNTT